MDQFITPEEAQRYGLEAWQWLLDHVFVWQTAVQAAIVLLAFLLARFYGPKLQSVIESLNDRTWFPRWAAPLVKAVAPLSFAVLWLLLQWFSVFAAAGANWPNRLIESVVSLLTAWVVIRFASSFVRDPGWAKTLALVAWTIAALNLVGLLDETTATLDAMAISFGELRLSVLGLFKAGAVLAFALWVAGIISRAAERRLVSTNVSPSARVLLGKLLQVLLIFIAIMMALESVGIDLTALAVFGGAIGLGIGFGLQKVISNLMSGVILLLDKSVKPGDVIAVDDTFGWINRLSARYVSVITRDGTEHLIPNEDLISQKVENWSYTDSLIRLKLPIGVAYETDVPKAMALAIESAENVERVMKNPAPVCRLIAFGSDAIELELRVWINDPQRGVVNVRSEVLLNVWHAYKENGVEFPFSQRDLHLRSAVPIDVRVDRGRPEDD